MRQCWIALAFFGLVAATFSPAATESAHADDPTSEVVARINAIRAQNGLNPLVVQPQLTASAQAYAQAMAAGKFFGHVAPNGSTLVTRDEAAGYSGWSVLEENLAAGQPTAAAVVDAWMHSQSHRDDILSPRVRETGVGFVFVPGSPYGYYWVEEFGTRAGVATAPPPIAVAKPAARTAAAPQPVAIKPAAPKPATPAPTPAVPKPAVVNPAIPEWAVSGVAAEKPHFVRDQRDPDNLNLYLEVYQSLGEA